MSTIASGYLRKSGNLTLSRQDDFMRKCIYFPVPFPRRVAFHPTFSAGRWVCGKHPSKSVMPTSYFAKAAEQNVNLRKAKMSSFYPYR
jgi:hypothetical protein